MRDDNDLDEGHLAGQPDEPSDEITLPPRPIVGDHLENLVLLGCGLLILVIALALCSLLFDKVSKARSASADWLEQRAARRRRRSCLKKYYPPVRSSHLRIVPSPADDSLARNALRRNAESHQTVAAASTKAAPALRLVKPAEREEGVRGKVFAP